MWEVFKDKYKIIIVKIKEGNRDHVDIRDLGKYLGVIVFFT